MILFTKSIKSKSNSVVNVFANTALNNKEIKYAAVKLNKEQEEILINKYELKEGQLLPSLRLGEGIIGNSGFYRLVNERVNGIIKFSTIQEALNFSNKYKQGEKLKNIRLASSYSLLNGETHFRTLNANAQFEFESIFFSHIHESSVHVYFNSEWKGFSYAQFFFTDYLPTFKNIVVNYDFGQVFYELGKIELKENKYDKSLIYFDITIAIFQNRKDKSYLIGNALRYKAKSLIKSNLFYEAKLVLLDNRCDLKTSWDYLYRSIIDDYNLKKSDLSLDLLRTRKNDLKLFRSLLIKEIQDYYYDFKCFNIKDKDTFEFRALRAFMLSYFYEAIYAHAIIVELNKIIKDKNSTYTGDDYYEAASSASLLSCIIDGCDFWDLFFIELDTKDCKKFYKLDRNRRYIKYFYNKDLLLSMLPDNYLLEYWCCKIAIGLHEAAESQIIDESEFCELDYIPDKYNKNAFEYAIESFRYIKQNLQFGRDNGDRETFYESWDVGDYHGMTTIPLLVENNTYDLIDVCFQKGLVHFKLKEYERCIDELYDQLKMLDIDLEMYDEESMIYTCDRFGYEKVYELMFILSKCEYELENYIKAYYLLCCANKLKGKLKKWFNLVVEKKTIGKTNHLKRCIIAKIGYHPSNGQIADIFFENAIKSYHLAIKALNNESLSDLKTIIQYPPNVIRNRKELYNKVNKVISDLQMHKYLGGKKRIQKLLNECFDFHYWCRGVQFLI
jgi:hypothetical protein